MARMEFLRTNQLNTTTMATATSGNGSGTYAYLFDRNLGLGYVSSGYTTNTVSVISVVFGTPVILSHIMLQNHNLRDFRLYYNSTTANSLGIVTGNSATSTYLSFASVTVSSVDLQMSGASSTDTERRIGELILTARLVQFDRNPTAKNYDPVRPITRVLHKMPDGGVTAFNIHQKHK